MNENDERHAQDVATLRANLDLMAADITAARDLAWAELAAIHSVVDGTCDPDKIEGLPLDVWDAIDKAGRATHTAAVEWRREVEAQARAAAVQVAEMYKIDWTVGVAENVQAICDAMRAAKR